jgi:hypothetical protein
MGILPNQDSRVCIPKGIEVNLGKGQILNALSIDVFGGIQSLSGDVNLNVGTFLVVKPGARFMISQRFGIVPNNVFKVQYFIVDNGNFTILHYAN